ncbi:hypothetical protein [Ectothiorhodospira shaposhnikovii]|uniref:hypothetical protein n=1 Tax=Ectothiorhodospira shaposhnikovii TaxID=1054 RepID=UPI0039A1BA04
MTSILLWVLALQAMAIVGWGMRKRERMIQFPFLAAAVFLGWMLPQLMGLTAHPGLPHGGLDKTIFMAILCLGAAWLGYEMNRRPARLFAWDFDHKRLLAGAAAMTLLGAFFYYQVSQLAVEVIEQHGGAWTGIITIYVFFSNLLTFGMALALILYVRKPNWHALALVLFGLVFYLERIVVRGRRAAMVELGVMVLLALWFNRRILPPRWVMVSGVVIGALVINSIGDYRSTMMGDNRFSWSGAGISEIMEIDFWGNLQQISSGEALNSELTNAVMNIAAADRTLSFDYGLSHWNGFVNRYVPGQWIGHDLKRAMMFDFTDQAGEFFGHRPHSGSTHTGLSDAFLSFWYFGAVKFLLIGLILSRWYRAAMQSQLVGQLVVILSMTGALHAITHSTHAFFMVFIQMAAFLLPVLWYARRRPLQQYRWQRHCV